MPPNWGCASLIAVFPIGELKKVYTGCLSPGSSSDTMLTHHPSLLYQVPSLIADLEASDTSIDEDARPLRSLIHFADLPNDGFFDFCCYFRLCQDLRDAFMSDRSRKWSSWDFTYFAIASAFVPLGQSMKNAHY